VVKSLDQAARLCQQIGEMKPNAPIVE